jgi:glycosyltransferase involved in cell wall biosynthesis
MRIEYVSAALDGSGYGSAARGNILALHQAGVDLTLTLATFEQKRPDLGEDTSLLASLTKPPDGATLRILHLTPDLWVSALKDKPQIPTIGYAAWEASRVPPEWVAEINKSVIELWVPSRHNMRAFMDSGVTVPVRRVPHSFVQAPAIHGPPVLPASDRFRFLSVFQWIERKNPLGLLKAYLTEFGPDEKVSLVLKTYLKDGTYEERDQIAGWIRDIKGGLRLRGYPQVELVVALLSSAEMARLYRECSCYVSLHRCEGFGIPIAEALLTEMPVVTTGYGGPEDMGIPVVPYSLTPVFGMPWTQYTGAMDWAEPDLAAARERMRGAFNRSPGKMVLGAEFSRESVGKLMRERLEALSK